MAEIVYAEESYQIVGACFQVYNEMGCGFLEAVYQECLEFEFADRKIPYDPQPPLALTYRGRQLKEKYKPDFICFNKIIVEIKAVSALYEDHEAQVQNYLKATEYHLGLLVNFGQYPDLIYQRIANTKSKRLKPN